MKLFAMAILLTLNSNVYGSMSGGSSEKSVPRCTIMGQVAKLDLAKGRAFVSLKKVFGSTTQMGCFETNAEKMIGQTVSISLRSKGGLLAAY